MDEKQIIGAEGSQGGSIFADAGGQTAAPGGFGSAVGEEQLREWVQVLNKYKAGKARTEQRIIAAENWWKLRNTIEERKAGTKVGMDGSFSSKSGWLHNVIASKHADAMASFPEPNILPREQDDKQEARILSAIIPCILEQNKFESTYDAAMWAKGKYGTGIYKVVWDAQALNGLGEISVTAISALNVFWEPQVTDIQKSKYFFHVENVDKETLKAQYPQLAEGLKNSGFQVSTFLADEQDSERSSGKAAVIEVYYHKTVDGRNTLQYCRFVDNTVLYATENEKDLAERGLYDHGKYPYVFDPLFPVEDSPCGYGYVDLCQNPQIEIDILKTAFLKNAMVGAIPRYFMANGSSVNEGEFLDLQNPVVKVNGTLTDQFVKLIQHTSLDGNYINVLNSCIQELRETSGNTETATGATPSGVTAASAIAALQEASGKGSRDSTQSSYRAYTQIVELCIELIRQFYTLPRKFRIVGQYGAQQFISYDNRGIQPQPMGDAFGVDMGMRLPVFDIKISAQKKNMYTQAAQNELALQFYDKGFFNPGMAEQALMCLDMMDFDGKDEIMQKIAAQAQLMQKLMQYMQMCLGMAQAVRPDLVEMIAQDMMQTQAQLGQMGMGGGGGSQIFQSDAISGGGKEPSIVANARARSNNASQPTGNVAVKGRENR